MNITKYDGGYQVPHEEFAQVMADMDSLGSMLGELIGLYEKESKLNKHHRAYLHVREYADKACVGYKENMREIASRMNELKTVAVPICKEEPVEFSELPKGLVLMTSDSLGVMHDDVICLTEGLDTMAALFKAIMAGCPMSKADVEAVLNMTSAMSDEILERWEKAEMIELN